jgi:endo-alpha-1,4-polygalactosaminidase (GH114 family)
VSDDQFQVDEALTHQRRSASTLQETKRAIAMVDESGAAALESPRTALFAQRGARIARDESTTARALARVIRERGTDFLTKLRTNVTRVTSADVQGTFPAKQYTFKETAGRDVLTIEYGVDDAGTRNAIVLADPFDSSGKAIANAERAVHFRLGDAPAGYMGDPTHGYVRRAPRENDRGRRADEDQGPSHR